MNLDFDKEGRVTGELYSEQDIQSKVVENKMPSQALSNGIMARKISERAQYSRREQLKQQLADWFN